MILAGDIGGTNTRLAYFVEENGALVWKLQAKYPSQNYPNLTDIVREFVTEYNLEVAYAAFGVAGPVVQGRVQTTNLPWIVDSIDLANVVKLTEAHLINDLEANSWGIQVLEEDDFIVLNHGSSMAVGNAAVISAGTGLGEAGLYWDGVKYNPFACEGGHADFSPRDALQVELLNYLLKKWDHVSWERVLSGPGLYNVYCFLRDTGRGDEPHWLADKVKVHDPARTITENAMSGTSPLCEKTLELFCALYGSEAGNLALKTMALGGVYLGGGIAPKIHAKLKDGIFMREFTEKGRMKNLLQSVPVRIILNENTALLGAAQYAAVHSKRMNVQKTLLTKLLERNQSV
jgi:glucokinase